MDDDTLERGDEPARYPPLGSPEWRERMQRATRELSLAQVEIMEHCAKINLAVTKIFRDEPF